MKSLIENTNNKTIFWFLCGLFGVFYIIQVPMWTTISDVLVYALRASADKPIFSYAFLDKRYLIGMEPVPNYHILHTAIYWLFYQIMPANLAASIWPAGLLSAISGGFVVGLTFLIWTTCGLKKWESLVIALFTGIIPSIWFQALIGEVYMLQMLLVLLFVYSFLKDKILPAALFFLCAVLITPLSALAFTFIFLNGNFKKAIKNGIIVGAVSLALYIIIFALVNPSVMEAFNSVESTNVHVPILKKIIKFGLIVLLNFHLFLILTITNAKHIGKKYKRHIIFTSVAILPQLLLPLLDIQFLVEFGSFLLFIFWGLALPVGLSIARQKRSNSGISFAFITSILVTLFVWQIPNKQVAIARNEAGLWLKQNVAADVKVVSGWYPGVGVTMGRFGWDLEKVSTGFYMQENPNEDFLLKVPHDSLVIATQKRSNLRKKMSGLPLPGFSLDIYNPQNNFSGDVKKLYENESVILYKWKKSDVP